MALDEEQLNGRIASIINQLTQTSGWQAREELLGALRGASTKPDILITRVDAPPIVLENEYQPANTVIEDCLKSIGREMNPVKTGASGKVNTVVALRSPLELKSCSTGDEARSMLMSGVELEFAVLQGIKEKYTRFPKNGFIKGDIRNLIEFIRPAAMPEDAIATAARELTNGTEDIAAIILKHAENFAFGVNLGEQLRQPWPVSETMAESPSEIKQERADQKARSQTAKMCAAIIINAMAYQENLAGYRGIRDLEQVRNQTPGRRLTKASIIAEWDNILLINYWPIFHIAKQLLLEIPSSAVAEITPRMVETADAIQETIRQNDVAGIVFQRLIVDRQTLATYYTRPESSVLAAHLAVPENLDWSDAHTFESYHIADYACGTGGLILAAYQRIRDLHRNNGGDPDPIHSQMMEKALTACDIMPAAVHLTSSLLSSVAPRERYKGTRNVLYPFGGVKLRDANGEPMVDEDNQPVFELDGKGNPVIDIGSLVLLDVKTTKYQVVLPLDEQMAMGATGKRDAIEVEMSPLSQDLVIMNPPFTTPTNHAADHVDTKNPAFAAFGTTEAEQGAMESKVKRLSKGTVGDGYAGLGSQFAAIADNMVKSGGHIALILPISSMIGGSHDGKIARSWQKLRNMLASNYNDIIVTTIAKPTTWDSAFSADTKLSEVIIVARRIRADEKPNGTAFFVNLNERPQSVLAAQETARSIRRAMAQLVEPETDTSIRVGDDDVGWVRLEAVQQHQKWTTVRIKNIDLVRVGKRVKYGKLHLPQRSYPVSIPIVKLGNLGRVGPVDRLIVAAFSKRKGFNVAVEFPMLWNHDARGRVTQDRMLTPPDSTGFIKSGKSTEADMIWQRASNLHINRDFQFNANATVACFTQRRSIGGRAWPNVQMDTPEMEKATCVWLNSAVGIIGYWLESNRTQNGRGGTTVTAIPNIPTLNVRALTHRNLLAAVDIYDQLCDTKMLPANEAYIDPVRQELDERLFLDVLNLDKHSIKQLTILRNQWCSEPTVEGTKSTAITRKTDHS